MKTIQEWRNNIDELACKWYDLKVIESGWSGGLQTIGFYMADFKNEQYLPYCQIPSDDGKRMIWHLAEYKGICSIDINNVKRDDVEAAIELANGARRIEYMHLSGELTTTPQRDEIIGSMLCKLTISDSTLQNWSVGPGIPVMVTMAKYNNHKEKDEESEAILCGHVDDYAVLGSLDCKEFCVKSFTENVKLDKTAYVCKSYRFIKEKYIKETYDTDISDRIRR